jgi:hypothetical protein
VWSALRCLIEIGTGGAGLTHAFSGSHGLVSFIMTFLYFDEFQRIAVTVFVFLVGGGVAELSVKLYRQVRPTHPYKQRQEKLRAPIGSQEGTHNAR